MSQQTAYKVWKHINKEEKDISEIKVMKEDEWLCHYTKLQTSLDEVEYNEREESRESDKTEWEEIIEALNSTKTKNSADKDRLNGVIYVYFRNI